MQTGKEIRKVQIFENRCRWGNKSFICTPCNCPCECKLILDYLLYLSPSTLRVSNTKRSRESCLRSQNIIYSHGKNTGQRVSWKTTQILKNQSWFGAAIVQNFMANMKNVIVNFFICCDFPIPFDEFVFQDI